MTSEKKLHSKQTQEKNSLAVIQEVNTLNQESWNKRRTDPKLSKQLAELALTMSKKTHYDLGMGEAYLNLSIFEGYFGQLDNTVQLIEKAIVIFERVDHPLGIVRACNSFGYIYIVRNELGKAFEYLNRGIQLSKLHNIDEMLIYLYYNIGEIYKNNLSLYQDALCYLLQALPLLEIQLQHPLSAALYGSIGLCYQKIGQLEKSMYYSQKALEHSQKLADKQTLYLCYHLLANIYKEQGDYKTAKHYVHVLRNLLDDDTDSYTYAYTKLTAAHIEEAEAHYPEAIAFGLEGLAVVNANKYAALSYHFYLVLAQCYEQINDFKLSSYYYKLYIAEYEQSMTKEVENRITVLSAELKVEEHYKELKLRMQNEKMAALSDIVTGVAHEINTPLGNAISIGSFLEDLEKELSFHHNSNQLNLALLNEYLENTRASILMLNQNLKRTANIVDSFKDVAMNRLALDLKTFNLSSLLQDMAVLLTPSLRSKHISLDINCPVSLIFRGYEELLRYVVTHLIQNAILHAFDDVENPLIAITVADEPQFLHISVYDNGIGIPKAHLDKIYNPFFTTKKANGGLGLGLNIVYNMITQLMNGTITVHSDPASGTVFELYFPKEAT